ncbi:uroporphyrinogen decarboxylase family protein [Victivallis lenta]|uniref:uroporphyrinogen decarboxylase family protein n=1 Tax=Victivallis lenta TaxID=2606640 RepID=UPI000D02B0E2|nr:uroporphyrinogen decarboxylase family protein [Victivallis lenta]AVM43294.1 hypothetical protein C5Q97_00680 [Victivallales bacterium CCUG 44730]HBP07619.1 hypothetical protein [Lentisphaeria bacterium]HCH86291.1 hypothetical protein [Lentisphaeria bacterium]
MLKKELSRVAPDYRRMVAAAENCRSEILPLYEHNVSCKIIDELAGSDVCGRMESGDFDAAFAAYGEFFRLAGYDVVTFEYCIGAAMPPGGALRGGMGPIQSRADLEAFPWEQIPDRYWDLAAPMFEALGRRMPYGMKAIGGVGNGAFELAEDLVGLQYLPFLEADDPEAHAELYRRIGDLMETIWTRFLKEFGELYCVCRIGDDLGFRSSLLTMPDTVRQLVIPQYKRVIDRVHAAGKPFLLHCCGCIFEVMDDLIAAGIDAKHSNEDAIAPFERWIHDYSDRIGLFGGIDMDFIVSRSPEEIRRKIDAEAPRFRDLANGFAIGTGNSIPDYVPAENYLAMLEAVNAYRDSLSQR